MGTSEQQDRFASEREEIAARVARFKATQEKFAREREAFYAATMERALSDVPSVQAPRLVSEADRPNQPFGFRRSRPAVALKSSAG